MNKVYSVYMYCRNKATGNQYILKYIVVGPSPVERIKEDIDLSGVEIINIDTVVLEASKPSVYCVGVEQID